MLTQPVYLDHNATTPIDPEVLEAMMPYLTHIYGNAASKTHGFGWRAAEAVQKAREQIAELIECKPDEIIFTSGATESDNLAIKGVALANRKRGNHIITSQVEHKAILDSCKALQNQGFDVTYLPVDAYGVVDPEDVKAAITDQTILISLIYANNEVGTIQPLFEIGEIARSTGAVFHSDAVQAVGKIETRVDALGVDLLSISGHKLYGPKGIGALYVRQRRPRVRLEPLLHGGGHERKLRSGTLNVPGIVGLGAACVVAGRSMQKESERLRTLRDQLYQGIISQLDYVYLNGHPTMRLPGTLNLSFEFVEGESLLMSLSDIAVSSGSACTSGALESSYVLVAMGVDESLANSSIRFGLGRYTTQDEIDYTIDEVTKQVRRLRELSPFYEMAVKQTGSMPL